MLHFSFIFEFDDFIFLADHNSIVYMYHEFLRHPSVVNVHFYSPSSGIYLPESSAL